MNPSIKLFKKLHHWPGLIISFLLIYYGITGIFLNHRKLFSSVDVDRGILPENYKYQNWNNAALKNNLIISPDSILLYGNIGIWLTDSTYSHFQSFHNGIPEGSDNRKIFDVHQAPDGNLYASTLWGLYAYEKNASRWVPFSLPNQPERFTGIESIGDTLYVINRSYLFKGKSDAIQTRFEQIELPVPEGYSHKVSLFTAIWQIHSGEIFGLPGRLVVDLLGLITIVLSITGIIYFFYPPWIRKRLKANKPSKHLSNITRWSVQWHNGIGKWTYVLLVVLFLTGMFLRPPLLISIASASIDPLIFTQLKQPNPWHDKLRDILYDPKRGILLISTSEGMYFNVRGDDQPVRFSHQPPVSIMGINTLQPYKNGTFLIGSFSGLFIWHPNYQEVYNLASGEIYHTPSSGRQVGDFKITGVFNNKEGPFCMIDYDKGMIPLSHHAILPKMPPEIIKESGMSLWNVSLEIHTGRFFQNFLGDFYILLVPLSGMISIVVVISGYLLLRKRKKRNPTHPAL